MPQEEAIKIVHKGIDITYNEGSNRFEFELRGRQRSAESLQAARAAIDKPVKEKDPDEKPFVRTDCYTRARYYEDNEHYPIVTATSVAEARWSGAIPEAFTSRMRNNRRVVQKQDVKDLFPVNDHNTAIVTSIRALYAQIDDIKEQIEKLESKLKPLTI